MRTTDGAEERAAYARRKGRKLNRNIHIYHGDFNAKVDEILGGGTISEKEATFCLLDQRTFECQWKTIEKLAAYKKSGNKIEIFYFLANGWLERALAAQKEEGVSNSGGAATTGPSYAR